MSGESNFRISFSNPPDQYQFGVAAVFCLAAQEVGQQFVHFGFGDAPQIEHVFIRKLVFCLYAAPLCLRGHFDTAADDAVRGQEPSENARHNCRSASVLNAICRTRVNIGALMQ